MAQCPPTKSDGQKNGEPLKLPATADFKNTIHNIESVLVLCTWTFDASKRLLPRLPPVITQRSIHFGGTKFMFINACQDF